MLQPSRSRRLPARSARFGFAPRLAEVAVLAVIFNATGLPAVARTPADQLMTQTVPNTYLIPSGGLRTGQLPPMFTGPPPALS